MFMSQLVIICILIQFSVQTNLKRNEYLLQKRRERERERERERDKKRKCVLTRASVY